MSVLRFESEVLENTKINHFVKVLKLSVPEEFAYEPGQYVSVILGVVDGKEERRKYSVAGMGKGFIEICFNEVPGGRFSPKLAAIGRGTKVTIQGPLGAFILKEDAASKDNVLISTGTGITPFIPMIQKLVETTKQNIILLAGYRHEGDVLYHAMLNDLQLRYKNFRYHLILSNPDAGYSGDTGHVQRLIEKYIPSNFAGDFYLCGLADMVKEVGIMLAQERKVGAEHIIFEKYN